MATRWGRVARGLVAASVAVFVAAFAHVTAGGQWPQAGGLALAFAFAALTSIALAGKRVSRVRLSIAVLLSQGLFHVLFDLSGPVHVAGSVHTMGMTMTTSMPTVTVEPLMLNDGWMWAAHALAAAATVVALVWGERAFWGLWNSARLALGLLLVLVAVRPSTAPLASGVGIEPAAPRDLLLAGAVSRRGPPRVIRAFA